MSYQADTTVFAKPTGALDPTQIVPGVATYLAPDPAQPEHYINVRLSNGSGYYTAGGTTVSGGGVLTADQGAPNLISAAWPIKVTDGSSVLGTYTSPFVVVPWSGTFGSSSLNPTWVTGTVWVASLPAVTGAVALTEPVVVSNVVSVTGTVALARAVDVASMPLTSVTGSVSIWGVSSVTGSVSLSRGVDVSSMPRVTGSVSLTEPVVVSNVVSVTGTVHLADVSAVTGTVALARAVDVASLPSITGSVSIWGVTAVTGTVHLADVSAVTGSVSLSRAVDVATMPRVTGSVSLTEAPNVTTLSGSVISQLVGGLAISQANPVPTLLASTSASCTNLTSSITSQLLLGTNTSRKGLIVVNDSGTSTMYLKFGITATTSSYTYMLAPNSTLELPSPTYTGRIDVIWTLAIGNARITETT